MGVDSYSRTLAQVWASMNQCEQNIHAERQAAEILRPGSKLQTYGSGADGAIKIICGILAEGLNSQVMIV